MDIEGAEYDAIPPAIEALCRGVDVLLLEMHARFFKQRCAEVAAGAPPRLVAATRLTGYRGALHAFDTIAGGGVTGPASAPTPAASTASLLCSRRPRLRTRQAAPDLARVKTPST